MTLIHLAIAGNGPLTRALRSHGAPFGRVRLTEEADPAVAAVLIDLPPAARAAATAAALRAGKLVLCPPPVTITAAELEAITTSAQEGGGRLLPAGEISHCAAGRRGLAAITAPEFGALR
jgi:predicted dehydrogenase